MSVVCLSEVRAQKRENRMQSDTERFIKDVVLPQLTLQEKLDLLHTFETKDARAFIKIVTPHVMRYQMRLENTN